MDDQGELNLMEIFAIFKRRFFTFFIILAVTFISSLLVTFQMPNKYRASSKVIIQNEINLYPSGLMPNTPEDRGFLRTQKEIMSSSFLINTALGNLKNKDLFKKSDYDKLKKQIAVDYLDDSNILEVNVYNKNAEEAVELANAIVNSFIQYHKNVKVELVNKSLEIVNNETVALRHDMDVLKTRLKEFSDKEQLNFYQARVPYFVNNIIELDKSNLLAESDIKRLKDEFVKTNSAIKRKDLEYFYPLLPNKTGESPTSSLSSIPWMEDLKKKISDAKSDLSRLIVEYTEDNPSIIAVRSQVFALQEELNLELENILKTYTEYYNDYIRFLENQKESNMAEKARYESELEKISKNIGEAASRQIEFNILLRTNDIMHDIYAELFKRQNELQVLRGQVLDAQLPNMRVFELASLPLKPVSPNLPLNLSLGLCFGLLIGIAGSFIEEKKESLGGREVVRRVGLPIKDRRSMSRAKKALVVAYEFKEKSGPSKRYAISENISGTGINIRLKEYLPTNIELSLEIHVSDQDCIYASGTVAWINRSKIKDMFDVGIHFKKITSQEREKLINYLYGESYLEKV